jgi:hypothetical protein
VEDLQWSVLQGQHMILTFFVLCLWNIYWQERSFHHQIWRQAISVLETVAFWQIL